jgi:hypothetical protein
LQLLTALQKTARDLIPVAVAGAAVAKAAAANSNTDANAPVNSAAISDSASPVPVSAPVMPWAKLDTTLAAALLASADTKTASQDNNTPTAAALPVVVTQLATLEAGLKNVIALLQKQAAIATAANQTAPATATPAATQTAAPLSTAPTQSLASADASAKATDNWQSQLFGIASTTAPQAQPQTSGQVFAASAAMVSAGDKNTGGSAFDGGSDNLMGRDASPSFGNATNAAAITAEGAQAVGTYNFASQLSAFRAANGGTMGLPSVVDQVILQMNRSVKSGNDQMSLQLQPGDMGKITVKLDFGSDGKVQGTVTAENPKTLDMLQKDSRSLERALQDAGLRADPGSLQFSLGGQSNSQNANQAAAGNANAPGAEDPTAVAPEDDLVTDLGVLAETYYITPTGVNIRV